MGTDLKVLEQEIYTGTRKEVEKALADYMKNLINVRYLELTISYKLDVEKHEVFEGFYDTKKVNVLGKKNYKAYFNDLAGFEKITGKSLNLTVTIKNKDFVDSLDALLESKSFTFMGRLDYLDGADHFDDGLDSVPLALIDKHTVTFNGKEESIEHVQIISKALNDYYYDYSTYAKVEFAPLSDTISTDQVDYIYGKPSMTYIESDNCDQFYMGELNLALYLNLGSSYFIKITLYK